MLGYCGSGMPESDANHHPEAFARVDLDEAVARLVEVIRRVRPQVVVTYPESQKMYPHWPSRVTEISLPAFDLAGDPSAYPEAGDPWTPQKLYATVWSKQRVMATHQAFVELGLESPFDQQWLDRPGQDHLIVARIAVHNECAGERCWRTRPRWIRSHRSGSGSPTTCRIGCTPTTSTARSVCGFRSSPSRTTLRRAPGLMAEFLSDGGWTPTPRWAGRPGLSTAPTAPFG